MTRMPGYPCETCRRESASITIDLPNRPLAMFCSQTCARDWMRADGALKQNEKQAVTIGGDAGGEYLEGIGVFDLRNLTPDQWHRFCATIFTATCANLARQADDEIPF